MGNVVFDIHTLMYAAAAVLIGFQSVTFAVFTKVFAISEGLLPEDPRLNRLFRYVNLEVGLIVGGCFILLGIGGSIWALSAWGRHSFGNLDPFQMMRRIVPTTTILTLGFQIILSSFFISVLGLRRRNQIRPSNG